MASKDNLRKQRTGTVINTTSEKREGKTSKALSQVLLYRNAIERLGKNVIGFRTALLNEAIFPFVCFGDGCDLKDLMVYSI